MAQQVKDPPLSLQQLGSLLWRMFDPWPRNFCVPWAWPKKKKQKQKQQTMKTSSERLNCLSEITQQIGT